MTKNKKILFIGKRLDAIKVAKEAGLDIYILNFKKTKGKKTKNFSSKHYFEIIYDGNFKSIEHIVFDIVIPLTEKAVGLAYEFFKSRNKNMQKYFLCHNKFGMKEFAQKNGLHVTPFRLISSSEEILACAKEWGFPLVIKEVDSSGSRGQMIFHKTSELPENFSEKKMIAEKWINGKEFSVESLVFDNKIVFSNITAYHTHLHCNILPAPFDAQVKMQISECNNAVLQKFDIQRGIAHAEYFLDNGKILLGEIAVRPPGGYLMKLIELAYEFSPWLALLSIESGTKPFIYKENQFYAASWIIHPGEGTVEEEPDFLSIVNHPAIVDIRCGLKKGMKIPRREGSGQDYGRILMKSKDINEIYSLIEKIKIILA